MKTSIASLGIQTITLFSLMLIFHISSASGEKVKCGETFAGSRGSSSGSHSPIPQLTQNSTSDVLIEQAILQYKALVYQVSLLKQSSSASSSSIAALSSEIASRKRSLIKAGVSEKELVLTQNDRELLMSELAKQTQNTDANNSNSEAQTQSVESDSRFKELQLDGSVKASKSFIEFSPDGKFMATGDEIVELSTGKTIGLDLGTKKPAYKVRFSPDSKQLVTGSKDGNVYLWEVSSGKFIKQLAELGSAIVQLEYSADGRVLAVVAEMHKLLLWDFTKATGQEMRVEHWPKKVIFSPDSSKLAIFYGLNRLMILNTQDLKIHTESVKVGPVNSLSFSGDGKKLIATEMHTTIRVLDANTLELKDKFEIESGASAAQAVSLGDSFIVGLSDGSLREYRYSDLKERVLVDHDSEPRDRARKAEILYALQLMSLRLTDDGNTLLVNWDYGQNQNIERFETRRWKYKSILR